MKNLYQRNGVWYWRRQVPTELADIYPKSDLRGSLGTRDKTAAKRLLIKKLAELDEEFDKHRARRAEAERARLEAEQRAEHERTYVASPAFRKAVSDVAVSTRWMDNVFEDGRFYDIDTLDRSSALEMIDAGLAQIAYERQHEISFVRGHDDEGEPLFAVPERLVGPLYQRAKELLDAQEASLLAKRAEIEARRPDTPAPEQPDGLSSLVLGWQTEGEVADKTVHEAKTAIRIFEKVNAALPYRTITQEHARRFKDHLLSLDRKAATKKKLWSMIRAILNHAKENSLLQHNPFDGITFRPNDDSAQRHDLTTSDLRSIFSTIKPKTADWWEFCICLYTGARLGEVHQLTRDDIRQNDGVWYFDFNDEGDKRLKNKNSRRQVPIHKQLLANGVMEMLPNEGLLFQGTKDAASKRLNRAIRDAGIIDKEKVLHSARHAFMSAGRQADLSEDVLQRLTGHTPGNEGRKYGRHSLVSLKAAIDKISFGIE